MAFQRVPDTAAVTLVFEQNNENLVNTVHAQKLGGYTAAEISSLANSVDNSVATNLRPEMVVDSVYLRTEVRGLDLENDFLAIDGTNGGTGAIAGPGLPNNVTLSIKRASAVTGRSARGRVYFVGMPSAQLTGNENQWDSVAVQNKQIAWEALRITIVNAGWTPVIVSRFANGLQRVEGVVFAWISTLAVNDNVDSQRGRLA